MSILTRNVTSLAIALGCLGFHSPAQSQTEPPQKPSTATVSGQVTVKGKGAVGVVVVLRLSDPGFGSEPVYKATTDQEGNYRIAGVPQGNYRVETIARNLVDSNSLTRFRGRFVILQAGERVEDFDFALVRGGVITGKVTNAEGKPIVEERISLFPAEPTNPRGTVSRVPLPTFQTDDRGIYRLFGVPAGRYKLAVGRSEDNFFQNVRGGRASYNLTFHPDVTDPGKATVIEIAEGAEATNVDVSVGRALATFAAEGVAVNGETGQPVANLRFGLKMIMGEARAAFVGIGISSNSLGQFRIENLTPGKYEVVTLPQQDGELDAEPMAFTIVDQDVSDLTIRTSKAASVTGTVVLDAPEEKAAQAKLAQLLLHVYVQGARSNSSTTSSLNLDGSFRIGALGPGTANFAFGDRDRDESNGVVILRIERDGVVQPRGIEVKSGEQIAGIRIVVAFGTGTIHGTINSENGALRPGTQFLVNATRSGQTSPQIGLRPLVDARGHFSIEGLLPGGYELEVTANVEGLPRRPNAKQRVSVANGVVTEVTITLDLNPNSEPAANQKDP